MDLLAIIFTILAFCGATSEHTALVVCAVYFVLHIISAFIREK